MIRTGPGILCPLVAVAFLTLLAGCTAPAENLELSGKVVGVENDSLYGRIVIVEVTVKNTGSAAEHVYDSMFRLEGANQLYENKPFAKQDTWQDPEIRPGGTASGRLAFAVAEDDTPRQICAGSALTSDVCAPL